MSPAPQRIAHMHLILGFLLCALTAGCAGGGGSAALPTAPVISSARASMATDGPGSIQSAPLPLPDKGTPHAMAGANKGGPTTSFTVSSDWGTGFTAAMTIANPQSTPIQSWRLEFDFAPQITSIWDARVVSHTSTHYVLSGNPWNADIPAMGKVSFGFNGAPGNLKVVPANVMLNGVPIDSGVSPTPTPAPSPSTSPVPTPAPSPTTSPSPQPSPISANVAISYATTSDWGSGFGGSVTIKNTGSTTISGWSLAFDFDRAIDSIWNVSVTSHVGMRYTVAPATWMTGIAPGQSVSFGFNGSPGNVTSPPTAWTFTTAPSSTPSPVPSPSPTPTPTPTASPTPTTSPTPTASPTPAPPPSAGGPAPLPARKRVAYFTEWSIYQRAYTPANIPADALDVVNYAFANISDSGQVVVYDSYAATDKAFPGDTWDQPLRGNFNQLIKLKQLHPNLRTMISVGGWTLSGRFSDVALTDASRQTFAQSAAAFAAKYGFDGVDIDWEYPVSGGLSSNVYRPDDRHNYTLLLQALRATLDAQGAKDGKRYLLTIAAPAGTSIYANLELAPVAGVIDWFNIMSYDYHGAWETTTNHHCPLYANPAAPGDPSFNIASTVKGYLAAGVPSTKIVLGVGAYGRSWSGVPATGNGLFQTSAGVPAGTWDSTGVFDYSDIVARLAAGGGWIRFWDDTAKVPWVYASGTGGGIFVTYDDPQGVALKTDYVVANRLGGVMMWELSSDVRDITSPLSLLRTVNAHLSP